MNVRERYIISNLKSKSEVKRVACQMKLDEREALKLWEECEKSWNTEDIVREQVVVKKVEEL